MCQNKHRYRHLREYFGTELRFAETGFLLYTFFSLFLLLEMDPIMNNKSETHMQTQTHTDTQTQTHTHILIRLHFFF